MEKLQRESEAHAAEDTRRREEIETRNAADSLAYNADKILREHGDKVPAELRQEVQGKVAAVRSALQSGDVSNIKSATEALSLAMQKIGSAVYQQAGAPPNPGAGPQKPPGGSDKGEGPVEGEFREV